MILIILALFIRAPDSFCQIFLKEKQMPKADKVKSNSKKIHPPSASSYLLERSILKKIHEENEKLNKLIENHTYAPIIWDGSKKIETTKTIRGLLLNSVVSTNLESPLLVQVFRDQGLPIGTRFSCKGITSNKRVLTYCDRMITPTKEVPVKVQILNTDGSSGLRGIYNDNKDSFIAGAVLSDLGRGIISASVSKLAPAIGTINEANEKAQIIEGLANSTRTTSDILQDEMKSQEPKVFIEAGKPVLIYFMESLNEY